MLVGAGEGAGDVVLVDDAEGVPEGQFPVDVDEEVLQVVFACSSVYGYLSSFELPHLQRRSSPVPKHTYDSACWLELLLEHDDPELLPPPPPLSLLPQAKRAPLTTVTAKTRLRMLMPS